MQTLHRYEARGAARALFACRAGEVLLSGPAGTGKSRACLEKLNLMAMKYPGFRGLIVRKTAVSLTSTVLVEWREAVVKDLIDNGSVRWYGGSAQEAAQYRYENGSVVVVGGLDKASRIMSSQYDAVYVNEAIELTVDDWEAITTRLRNGRLPYQQLMADTNPSSDVHWLNQRCNAGQTIRLESRHEENPVYFHSDGTMTRRGREYMSKLDSLTGVRYLRLRKGQWVGAEGVIYEDFDQAVHVVPQFDIPAEWTRWWAVDFGYTNPFVCQFWAEDPDGRLYLYREVYHTRRLVEDHARRILDIVAPKDPESPYTSNHGQVGRVWIEPRPRAIVCDHDAEDRATLERHLGLATTAAKKTVSNGIQAVQSRMKTSGDGRSRLFMFRNALVERDTALADAKKPTCTAEEVGGYVWNPGKDQPVKEDDHGCDAMRYVVAERDLGGRGSVRWL